MKPETKITVNNLISTMWPYCPIVIWLFQLWLVLLFSISMKAVQPSTELRVDWDVNNMLASVSRLIISKMMTSSAIGAGKELYQFSPHRKVHQIETADDYQPFSFLSSV